MYIKDNEVTVEDATGQNISRQGKRIRGVVGDFGQGVGNGYYSESRRSLAVKTFDNYTVITVSGKKTEVHPQTQPPQQGSMGDSL